MRMAHSSAVVGVLFLYPLVRAVCFIRAKQVRHANWSGSKGRVSEDGDALNALGFLEFLARPLVNH